MVVECVSMQPVVFYTYFNDFRMVPFFFLNWYVSNTVSSTSASDSLKRFVVKSLLPRLCSVYCNAVKGLVRKLTCEADVIQVMGFLASIRIMTC